MALYFSILVDEFSLKPVYPIMVREKFQVHVVHITGKCICKSKN